MNHQLEWLDVDVEQNLGELVCPIVVGIVEILPAVFGGGSLSDQQSHHHLLVPHICV